jgi:hypothetical protein
MAARCHPTARANEPSASRIRVRRSGEVIDIRRFPLGQERGTRNLTAGSTGTVNAASGVGPATRIWAKNLGLARIVVGRLPQLRIVSNRISRLHRRWAEFRHRPDLPFGRRSVNLPHPWFRSHERSVYQRRRPRTRPTNRIMFCLKPGGRRNRNAGSGINPTGPSHRQVGRAPRRATAREYVPYRGRLPVPLGNSTGTMCSSCRAEHAIDNRIPVPR